MVFILFPPLILGRPYSRATHFCDKASDDKVVICFFRLIVVAVARLSLSFKCAINFEMYIFLRWQLRQKTLSTFGVVGGISG